MSTTANTLWAMEPNFSVQIEYILAFWHLHRIPVILITIALLIFFKTSQNARVANTLGEKTNSSSPIPTTEKSLPIEKIVERTPRLPRKIVGGLKKRKLSPTVETAASHNIQVLVFFSSVAGSTEHTAKAFTTSLTRDMKSCDGSGVITFEEPELIDLSDVDYDEYFISTPKGTLGTHYLYLILLPTYNIDTSLDTFIEHLRETHNDFRIDNAPLSSLLGYSVFGFGDREGWPTEEDGFCSQAREVDKWMAKLTGSKRAFPLGMGDTKTDAMQRLDEWKEGVKDVLNGISRTGSLTDAIVGIENIVDSDADDMDDENIDQSSSIEQSRSSKKPKPQGKNVLNDLEDIGIKLNKTTGEREVDFTTSSDPKAPVIKKMVPENSPTYAALTKQGYSIVGSHSGVKICRWTKSALRGRGSCYKYSFYGIASHQCMETTPSLSCSNKCVFCWRHVCAFVEALSAELTARNLGYGIAAEHAHSCCVLIASERFRVQGKWHTRIDYQKFFQCLESGAPFSPEDYMGPETPEWATWGRGGFDPRDDRVDRKGRKKEVKTIHEKNSTTGEKLII
ncbi:hypothetical protein K3495_g459 [Podosphaera aphanis]|nr:hypothetical protein K3495_g459 [Podosphaera aphanis]